MEELLENLVQGLGLRAKIKRDPAVAQAVVMPVLYDGNWYIVLDKTTWSAELGYNHWTVSFKVTPSELDDPAVNLVSVVSDRFEQAMQSWKQTTITNCSPVSEFCIPIQGV